MARTCFSLQTTGRRDCCLSTTSTSIAGTAPTSTPAASSSFTTSATRHLRAFLRLSSGYKAAQERLRAEGKYRLSKFPLDSYLGLPPEAIDLLQGEERVRLQGGESHVGGYP